MDFVKKNKIVFISIGILVLIVIAVLIFIPKSNEEELKVKLSELGKDFYENYYYDRMGTDEALKKEQLSKFENIGIKVDLENLSRYENNEEILSFFVNSLSGVSCNTENTKVIIYPKSDYNKGSYEMEIILDCGFEN